MCFTGRKISKEKIMGEEGSPRKKAGNWTGPSFVGFEKKKIQEKNYVSRKKGRDLAKGVKSRKGMEQNGISRAV